MVSPNGREVGVDEVGRGAWAGPVVVGAVSGPTGPLEHLLSVGDGSFQDSKALSPRRREAFVEAVWGDGFVIGLGSASPAEIDLLGLREALRRAAQRALELVPAELVLLDGTDPYVGTRGVECVVHGDRRHPLIAAASIVAKVARDRLMVALDALAPHYGFARHKGYGTRAHRAALERYGPSPWHRRSVAPVAASRVTLDVARDA